jgi:hypothetical protein
VSRSAKYFYKIVCQVCQFAKLEKKKYFFGKEQKTKTKTQLSAKSKLSK